MILIYFSPILSLLPLMLVPIAYVYFFPQQTVRFLSIQQFIFVDVPVKNLHILLVIWSTITGVAVSTEIVSWYLLKEEKTIPNVTKPKVLEEPAAASFEHVDSQKSVKIKVENLLLRLGNIMSGKKS